MVLRTRDYAVVPGIEKCREMFCKKFISADDVVFDGESGCWLVKRSLFRGGYARAGISLNGKRTSLMMHRVAFTCWNGRDIRPGMISSHLCRRRNCFNPTHIIEESQKVNLRRSMGYCTGTFICNKHDRILIWCPHEPRCLQVTKIDCCVIEDVEDVEEGVKENMEEDEDEYGEENS
ncbi:hypothetical protein GGR57DRAFT_470498 [Xylariaceae sp. FL1272]|nr:hypothetical protein GGR57DRAFT_470498 [Xylariaceae sp. FL1272]